MGRHRSGGRQLMDQIKAPFTDKQVAGLNYYQKSGGFHEFTCGGKNHPSETDNTLIATNEGWICPNCDYKQNWAHSFMAMKKAGIVVDDYKVAKAENLLKKEGFIKYEKMPFTKGVTSIFLFVFPEQVKKIHAIVAAVETHFKRSN